MAKRKRHTSLQDLPQIVDQFFGLQSPKFIEALGAWHVGGRYYRLWQNRYGVRALTCSRSPDPQQPQELVKGWIDGGEIPYRDTFAIISNYARGRQHVSLIHGTLLKTRDRHKSRDIYIGQHQHYQVDFDGHDVLRVTKGILTGLDGRLIAGQVMWAKPGDGTASMSRKEAELMISKDYVETLNAAMSSHWHVDPHLREDHPIQFRFVQAKRLMERVGTKLLSGLEKLDTGYSIIDNVITFGVSLSHPISAAWKMAAALIESRSLLKSDGDAKLPGALDAKDPVVRIMSDASGLAYPLSGYTSPLAKGIFEPGDCLNRPTFGDLALYEHIPSIPSLQDDGINGLSEAYLGPDFGSTVRLYDKGDAVGAMRIYIGNGLTATHRDVCKVWVSHEEERQFDPTALIPTVLGDQLKPDHITEIVRGPAGVGMRQLSFDLADLEFRRDYGDSLRTPHYPAAAANHGMVTEPSPTAREAAL